MVLFTRCFFFPFPQEQSRDWARAGSAISHCSHIPARTRRSFTFDRAAMKGLATICLCSVLISLVSCFIIDGGRFKRQTFVYDDELKQVAQIHPGTKIIVGHAGRYA
ncbi:hypothetical protein PMAYCL1PPCAC_31263, partial [Pristionchus mayeri]